MNNRIFNPIMLLVLSLTLVLLVACSQQAAAPAEPTAQEGAPAAVEKAPPAAEVEEVQQAPAEEAASEEAAAPADSAMVGEKTLNVYWGFDTEAFEALAPLFEQFTAETGVSVNIIEPEDGDLLAKIQADMAAGSTEIDVYDIDVVWPGIFAEDALDLSPYITAAELEAHMPAIIENYRAGTRLVALPYFTDVGLLYYRTDLLEKYGFAGPPQTWDELEEMAAAIQAGEQAEGNDEFWGFVWQGAAYEGLACDGLEWQASQGGGRIIEPDGTITINNPGAIAAFERAAGWVGTISPPAVINYTEEETDEIWTNGNAAFMRNWPYDISYSNDFDTLKDRFGYTVLPAGDTTHAATMGGWALMVSKHSDQPEAAARFVQLVTGLEGQKQIAIFGYLPTVEALYSDPDVLAAQPYIADMLPVVQSAVARPSTVTGAQYDQVSQAYANHVNAILAGEATAAEEVANLETELIKITGFQAQMP